MTKHRFYSAALSCALLLTTAVPAFAADVTTSGSSETVPVPLTAEASTFSVTLPTALPINMDGSGAVVVASDAVIINHSSGPVAVQSVTLNAADGWTLRDFDTAFSKKQVGVKEFGFSLLNSPVPANGKCKLDNFSSISGSQQLNLPYDANIAVQGTACNELEIASVEFVIGWDKAAPAPSPNPLPSPNWEDSNPMTSEEITAIGLTFDSKTGAISKTKGKVLAGALHLPSSVDGIRVSRVKDYGFIDCRSVSELTIPTSIVSIGEGAFGNWYQLKTVAIPDSVVSIGESAFGGCTVLKEITMGANVQTMGQYPFKGSQITRITIPASMTEMAQCPFYGCDNLQDIYNYSSHVTREELLLGCPNQANVTVHNM